MAVNPLDPTKPTLTDVSIELTAELRAIKQRLVTDKNNIEQLQSTLINISGITAFGAALMASVDADAALNVLGFTVVGKAVAEAPSWDDLADQLGVTSPVPIISLGSQKWSIELAGGVKINIVVVNCPSAGMYITWQTPFAFSTYGAVVSIYNDVASQAAWSNSHTLTGCYVDHSNSSTQTVCIIAIGN